MPSPDSSSDYDVSPRLLAVARALGVGEITARWKIIRFQRWWRRLRQDLAPASRRFDRQICQSCGTLQASSVATCGACGKRVGSRAGAALRAAGLSIPTALSVSSGLGVAMVAIYARMMIARSGQGILSWDVATLVEFGGDYPPAVHAGQWWRLGTAIFLHIGLWHIAFNLIALAQIGPSIEEIFGRGRMLFFFLVTGVVANIGSEAFGHYSVSAGASGALMGLIGVAAGWGQRVGTTHGLNVRNQMLKWAAYTIVFGQFIGANNWAHGGGFVSGAVLGFAFNPFRLEASKRGTANVALGAAGLLATGVLVLLCVKPPAASHALATGLGAQAEENDADDESDEVEDEMDPALAEMEGEGSVFAEGSERFRATCALEEQGKMPEALDRLRIDAPPDSAIARASGPQLSKICKSRRIFEARCNELKKKGVEAVFRPLVPLDVKDRESLLRMYERMCDHSKSEP